MTETPWEPPLAADEATQLLAALDRQRATFRWKADGLDSAGLNTRIGASTLTIGRLLKHLAVCEDNMFNVKFKGGSIGSPWEEDWEGDDDWQFTSADTDSPEHLYRLWDDSVARSRDTVAKALADGGLDQPAAVSSPAGEHASLRRLVCDMLEEYGRHTGHADLLREAVDGRVGEDPPPGWKPVS